MGHVTLASDGYPRLVPSDLAVFNNHLACIRLINAAFIFGGDRVEQGTLYLVRDVLDVLNAHESGVTNCVCFLTEISALQIEMLAALMGNHHCDTVELF
jgi:hypothetical protein